MAKLEAQYREKRWQFSATFKQLKLFDLKQEIKQISSRLRLAECNGVYGRPRLMVDALCDDIGPELVTNFQVGTSDELT